MSEETETMTEEQQPIKSSRRLSTISKQYDFDGDGKLDEAEMAVREMHTGDGLDKRAVYDRVHELLETQRSLMNVKRLLMVMTVVAVLLLVSMFAVSLAVARLVEQTGVTMDDRDEMVMIKGGEKHAGGVVHTAAEGHAVYVDESSLSGGDPFGIAPNAGSVFFDGKGHGDPTCTMEDYLFNATFLGNIKACQRFLYATQKAEMVSLLSGDEENLAPNEVLDTVTVEPTQHWDDPMVHDGKEWMVHLIQTTMGHTEGCHMFVFVTPNRAESEANVDKPCHYYKLPDCAVPACLL